MLDDARPASAMEVARRSMVESQLRPNRVTDERLLTAMEALPRENFVPAAMRALAYVDEDIEVARGRWLLEPMVLARLLQAAEIKATDNVLDLSCTTGYSTAVLAQLAAQVIAVETDHSLMVAAQAHTKQLGLSNVKFQEGAATHGCGMYAPYQVILINGAVEQIPSALIDQLAEGGRLVTVFRDASTGTGKARLYVKNAGELGFLELFDANSPVLPAFNKPSTFVL